jgi:phenylacetate-coenzyme A ligase PaaK-like adenylate-forming protein
MVALAAAAMGAPRGGGPETVSADDFEVRHYVLTLDKAQKAATAMQAIDQLVAANPSLNAALDASSSTTGKKPITQQAHDIDTQYQQVAAIVHQNGLATREFIVIIGALINDLGWVSMKRQGMVQSYPPGMITPENAALIEANWAAFQALGAKMTPPSTR